MLVKKIENGFVPDQIVVVPNPEKRKFDELTVPEFEALFIELKKTLLDLKEKERSVTGWNVFSCENINDASPFLMTICPRRDGDGLNEIEWYAKSNYVNLI